MGLLRVTAFLWWVVGFKLSVIFHCGLTKGWGLRMTIMVLGYIVFYFSITWVRICVSSLSKV